MLKENGHSISLLFGQYANKACVARWKICSADDNTDADLPVSITMMDSSLAEVSAGSDARDVALNRLKHFMPCSDPGPDGSAINQHCSTVDGAGISQQGAVGGVPFGLGMFLQYFGYKSKCLNVHVQLGHAFSCGVF